MRKLIFIICLSAASTFVVGQSTLSIKGENKTYRSEQNEKFKNKNGSPLKAEDCDAFKKLHFFRIKKKYRVEAKFVRTPGSEPFEMPTTTDRKPIYEKYGEVQFEIKGKSYKLNVYQSHDSRRNPLYRDYLFLPFKDLTNGHKSYGGGRFIDLRIPKGETVTIDFNKSYNPYCAYNDKYSCPIVPIENHLKVEIKAGVRAYDKH